MGGFTSLDQVYGALGRRLQEIEDRLDGRVRAQRAMPRVASESGSLIKYYQDLKQIVERGGIKFARIESIDFTCQASAAGPPVLTQPAPTRVDDGYLFALRRIYGYMSDPATAPGNIATVTYQIREEGTARDVFRTRQQLAYSVGSAGTSNTPMIFEGVYVFSQGADLRVDFAIGVTPIAWIAGAKAFGICLVGDLYSVNL